MSWISVTAIGSMPDEGFVEEDELRRGDERARDLEAAALAARELVRDALSDRREPELGEVLLERSRRLRRSTGSVSRMARRFSSTVMLRKIDGSCDR